MAAGEIVNRCLSSHPSKVVVPVTIVEMPMILLCERKAVPDKLKVPIVRLTAEKADRVVVRRPMDILGLRNSILLVDIASELN